jgi:hypothetical protein
VNIYSLGDTWTGNLPPGDSFGVHISPGAGVMTLGAVGNLRTAELAGFRDGTVRVAVGPGPEGVAIIAYKYDGWGWCDGAAANIDTLPDPIEEYREMAERWATGEGHLAVAGVLVDRGAGDAIAALRYFTLSPHVSRTLGRLLVKVYAGPTISEEEYAARVYRHQAAHPDIPRWVKAATSCRGGD